MDVEGAGEIEEGGANGADRGVEVVEGRLAGEGFARVPVGVDEEVAGEAAQLEVVVAGDDGVGEAGAGAVAGETGTNEAGAAEDEDQSRTSGGCASQCARNQARVRARPSERGVGQSRPRERMRETSKSFSI